MRKLLLNLKALAETFLANAVYTYDKEPARAIALLTGAVLYVARTQGIGLDEASVGHALAEVLAVIAAGEGIRRKVKPVR